MKKKEDLDEDKKSSGPKEVATLTNSYLMVDPNKLNGVLPKLYNYTDYNNFSRPTEDIDMSTGGLTPSTIALPDPIIGKHIQLPDGDTTVTALSWQAAGEQDSGFIRVGANDYQYIVNGSSVTEWLASAFRVNYLTQGSVLFSGASGKVEQDNANFFWDDTNNRLGIGINTPNSPVEIAAAVAQLRLTKSSTFEDATFWVTASTVLVTASDATQMEFSSNKSTGEIRYLSVYQSKNVGAFTADAQLYAHVVGASSGDPMVQLGIDSTNAFAMGVDNSDSDKFKISYSASSTASLGTNDRFIIDTSGNVGIGTSPSYPFHASAVNAGITYQMAFSVATTNTEGLNLFRSTTGTPVGVTLFQGSTAYWGYAMDSTSTDLVLTYDISSGNDTFRTKVGTGCFHMGYPVASPSSATRLLINSSSSDQAAIRTLLDLNASSGSPVTTPLSVRSTAAGVLVAFTNNAASPQQNIGIGSGASPYLWVGPSDGTGLSVAMNGVVTAFNELNVGTATDTATTGDFVAGLTGAARMFYDQSNAFASFYGSDGTEYTRITGANSGTGVKLIKSGDAGRNFLRWNQSTLTWQSGFRASPYTWVLETQSGTSTPADDTGWTSCLKVTTAAILTVGADTSVGTWAGGSSYAAFANQAVFGTTASYALIQGPTGDTFLNASSGNAVTFRINNVSAFQIDANSIFIPKVSLATGMTTGFINIPGAAGAPSGTPATTTGFPFYWDSTNKKLYVYSGGTWMKGQVGGVDVVYA